MRESQLRLVVGDGNEEMSWVSGFYSEVWDIANEPKMKGVI